MFTAIILSGFKIAIAPTISHMYQKRDNGGVKLISQSTVRWALYLAMPILIFVIMNTNILVTGVFGLAYQAGAIPLFILTIGQMIYVSVGIADQIFLMTGKQNEWLTISLLIFVLTIILDAIFISKLQLIGASIVSSTMMLLMGIIVIFRLKRHLNFWLFDKHHLKIVSVSFITTFITYLLVSTITLNIVLDALVTFLLIYVQFIIFLLLAGPEESDKAIIYGLIRKFTWINDSKTN